VECRCSDVEALLPALGRFRWLQGLDRTPTVTPALSTEGRGKGRKEGLKSTSDLSVVVMGCDFLHQCGCPTHCRGS
jgi:hypothetical protein